MFGFFAVARLRHLAGARLRQNLVLGRLRQNFVLARLRQNFVLARLRRDTNRRVWRNNGGNESARLGTPARWSFA
jgi:hypothetical protein